MEFEIIEKQSDILALDQTSLQFRQMVDIESFCQIVSALFKKREMLTQALDSCNWYLGDAIVAGQKMFGETCSQAINPSEMNEDIESPIELAFTSEGVRPQIRRSGTLTRSHHIEVNWLPPEQQEKFLKVAEEERLSIRELRKRIRDEWGYKRQPKSKAPKQISVTCVSCGEQFEWEIR